MNYLLMGKETKKKISLLLKLTKIKSEPVQGAIKAHLVQGFSEKDAYIINGVSQSNFNRAMVRLNEVAGIFEQLEELKIIERNQLTELNRN